MYILMMMMTRFRLSSLNHTRNKPKSLNNRFLQVDHFGSPCFLTCKIYANCFYILFTWTGLEIYRPRNLHHWVSTLCWWEWKRARAVDLICVKQGDLPVGVSFANRMLGPSAPIHWPDRQRSVQKQPPILLLIRKHDRGWRQIGNDSDPIQHDPIYCLRQSRDGLVYTHHLQKRRKKN